MVVVIVVALLLVASYVVYEKKFTSKVKPIVVNLESSVAKVEDTVTAVVTDVETKL